MQIFWRYNIVHPPTYLAIFSSATNSKPRASQTQRPSPMALVDKDDENKMEDDFGVNEDSEEFFCRRYEFDDDEEIGF